MKMAKQNQFFLSTPPNRQNTEGTIF